MQSLWGQQNQLIGKSAKAHAVFWQPQRIGLLFCAKMRWLTQEQTVFTNKHLYFMMVVFDVMLNPVKTNQ
ncbi:MAG: hypothetical protein IPL50_15115 [Chitinophagaceae bacterium]|nr:hypothetical protein [Chitinophagaceae bacterium]